VKSSNIADVLLGGAEDVDVAAELLDGVEDAVVTGMADVVRVRRVVGIEIEVDVIWTLLEALDGVDEMLIGWTTGGV